MHGQQNKKANFIFLIFTEENWPQLMNWDPRLLWRIERLGSRPMWKHQPLNYVCGPYTCWDYEQDNSVVA
jgi:hypothetical protein